MPARLPTVRTAPHTRQSSSEWSCTRKRIEWGPETRRYQGIAVQQAMHRTGAATRMHDGITVHQETYRMGAKTRRSPWKGGEKVSKPLWSAWIDGRTAWRWEISGCRRGRSVNICRLALLPFLHPHAKNNEKLPIKSKQSRTRKQNEKRFSY